MPRYRVNVRFGPWRVGEEFESLDYHHAKLEAEGLLTVVGSTADEAEGLEPDEDGFYDLDEDGDVHDGWDDGEAEPWPR